MRKHVDAVIRADYAAADGDIATRDAIVDTQQWQVTESWLTSLQQTVVDAGVDVGANDYGSAQTLASEVVHHHRYDYRYALDLARVQSCSDAEDISSHPLVGQPSRQHHRGP